MADEIESTEDELEQAEAEHQQYLDERTLGKIPHENSSCRTRVRFARDF
jgi:hypothetical protein